VLVLGSCHKQGLLLLQYNQKICCNICCNSVHPPCCLTYAPCLPTPVPPCRVLWVAAHYLELPSLLDDTWGVLLGCVDESVCRGAKQEADGRTRQLAASARDGLLLKRFAAPQLVRAQEGAGERGGAFGVCLNTPWLQAHCDVCSVPLQICCTQRP
jgi:hypothetical protein